MSQDEITQVLRSLQKQVSDLQHENMTLRDHFEEADARSKDITSQHEYLKKKYNALSQENSTYRNTQARMENQIYTLDKDLSNLRKETQQLTKTKKDAEKKLASELENFENDRVKWQQREAELYNQIRTISAGNGEPRTPRRRSITSSSLNGMNVQQFGSSLGNISEGYPAAPAPSMSTPHSNGLGGNSDSPKLAVIDSSFAREAKIASRTIKAQDKLISDLKTEVEKQKNAVQENLSQLQKQSLKMEHLEHEISNVKQLNRSLQEDNESYQMLLHEKTMNGEIMLNSFMQTSAAKADTLEQDIKPQPSQSTTTGLNLAAELNMASGPDAWDNTTKESGESATTIKKLNEEVKTLQDTNRALQLYMNKILMKIVTDKQLVDVLSIDAPKPKPKDDTPEPLPKISGPMPSKTTSTGFMGRSADTKAQRRRTISYWGSRSANPVVAALAENDEDSNSVDAKADDSQINSDLNSTSATEKNLRRHSTLSEKANGGTGSWAKTLRRMTVMGWSSAPTKDPAEESSEKDQEDTTSLKVSRSMSSSPSSFRRSAERDSLGTLAEE
ncbi:hypothetical protein VKS41_006254 [Umbelopsis sp. WA50703]